MSNERYSTLRMRWWETCSAIVRPYLRARGVTLRDLTERLDLLQSFGFDAVEVFAPCAGGVCYGGLDTIDFYRVDPALGTLEDFEILVREAHRCGMAVIAFLNLGYGHEQFPAFLKACDDVRAGVDSPERRWFVWSDSPEKTMDRSLAPHFMNDLHGNWRWSERAGSYFWVKWEGDRGGYHLPQFNFGDPGWQAETRRILEFWLQTGIDGVVIDAVNWYIDCNWQITRTCMTDVVAAAGDLFRQPEGAGGFHDDPLPWIVDGGFNCVQDYALQIWWEGKDLVRDAIRTGNPQPIEMTLRDYRDRVAVAGGVCYMIPSDNAAGGSTAERLLNAAVVATVGELFVEVGDPGDPHDPYREGVTQLLAARRNCPALCAGGTRTQLATDNEHCYAFMRSSSDGNQHALVALNFQAQPHVVALHPGAQFCTMTNLLTGEYAAISDRVTINLPGYGYALYLLDSAS